jgi:NADPH-dependent 2,4-dienoyl-CoA reductase/sulfur reductase-like enzyme
MKRLSRRRFVAAAAACSGAWIAGCAVTAPSAKPRVVVVGGGWGGLGAARTLAEGGRASVTLIEPNERFMSCPLSVHYVAGFTDDQGAYQRSYANVDRLGVTRLRARATEIDRAGSAVVVEGARIRYDFLVLAPGVDYIEDGVQGYAQSRGELPVGFRAFEQEAVRRQVELFFQRGGNFVISVPQPPYRCPPAPYERAMLIAEQARRRKVKGKVIVVDANATPLPPPIAAPLQNAMASEYPDVLEYIPSAELRAVDIGRRVLSTAMGEVPFTAANVVLPMRAPAIIRQAGLGERWAAVRLPSFQSQADDKVYVIGDATGVPLPKAGHLAFGAGQQVAREIERRIAGQPAPAVAGPVPLPSAICWAAVKHDEAINITVTSSVELGQAPQVRIQVDPRHNAKSAQGAQQWGESIWKQMLG